MCTVLNAETSIEDVEQLMEDTAEALQYQEQISELLGGKLTEDDEAAIQAQVDEWESEDITEGLETLPEVPVTTPTTKEPVVTRDTNKVKQKQKEKGTGLCIH